MSMYTRIISFVIISNTMVQRAWDLFLCPRIPLQGRLLPTPAAQQASQLLGARRRPGLKQLWRPWIRRVYNPPLWCGRGLAQRHHRLLHCWEIRSGRAEASRSSETGASVGNSNWCDHSICSLCLRQHSGHGLETSRSLPSSNNSKSQDLQEKRNHADGDGTRWKQIVSSHILTLSHVWTGIFTNLIQVFWSLCCNV